jgi:acyl-CoA thioesterase
MAVERRLPAHCRARATLEGAVVAESAAALRVEVLDSSPELWFPREDVRQHTIEGSGDGLARVGADNLKNYLSFDPDKVRIDLIDSGRGDDERDITVKRFPTWGDATDLIDLMNVQLDEGTRFCSQARSDWRRPVVEGSQILGQALVAASRLAPGRRTHSASMIFTRGTDARRPYWIEFDEISSGRTFTAMQARARQAERTCALGTLLLGSPAHHPLICHAESAPNVAGPYESTPCDMSVTGRDVRIVDDAYTGDPDAPLGPPEIHAWVRFRDVPDDQPIHGALLAQFTGHMSIAAALRPHPGVGQSQAHRTLSTSINAISLSIHSEVQADRWMLYSHRSTFAGDGMTHSECRVHSEDGLFVASFTVDAMVRAFADIAQVDSRTAM